MSKSKQWSVQTLVEESFGHKDENGNEVIKKQLVLNVCTSGMELYRKAFKDGEYKGKNQQWFDYEFVVLGGVPCPRGKFYELSYTIGGMTGWIYRALLQLVNPVTDVRTVLAVLSRERVLPEGFTPRELRITNIDAVCIGSCSRDDDGVEAFFSGHVEPKPEDTQTITERVSSDKPLAGVCLEYYRGDCREMWANREDALGYQKVFVCGSENVGDPEFEARRKADFAEMLEMISEAESIAADYGLQYLFVYPNGVCNEDGTPQVEVSRNCTAKFTKQIVEFITAHPDSEE